MKQALMILALFFPWLPGHAQFVADYKRAGDLYFARQDYYSAAQYYYKALVAKADKGGSFVPYTVENKVRPGSSKKARDYEDLVYRLAESYRGYNDFTSACKWYGEVVQFSPGQYPLARYWYGVCLRAIGQYEKALTQFQQFRADSATQDSYQADAVREIANCRFASEQIHDASPRIVVTRLGNPENEGGANYAPLWRGGQLTFTSSRALRLVESQTGGKDPYINHLFEGRVGDSAVADRTADGSHGSGFHRVDLPAQHTEEGVSALTPDGQTMFVTQWTVGKDGKKHAELYRSARTGASWSTPVRLDSLDGLGFSTMQPCVSTDGKFLLFASDRPGGSGGFDLWFSPLDAGGNPGAPVNLGTTINTSEDEEAPYYNSALKTLIFSTNARVGMGNFDLFESQGDLANWTEPVNLGYPVNSAKDDMYFTAALGGPSSGASGAAASPGDLFRDAYISSDRASACCLELFHVTRRGRRIAGLVIDCETGTPLEGAKVSLIDTVAGRVISQKTLDTAGSYGFDLADPGDFKIVISKEDYFSKNVYVTAEEMRRVDTLINRELCMKHFVVGRPIVLQNIYYDYNKATLRPESMTVLDTLAGILKDNPDMHVQLGAHTDSIGSTPYNLRLSDARAQACVDYLVSRGIDPARLTGRGYGRCCPIEPEHINGKDNPAGRQMNRRTEFTVLKQ